MVNFVIGLVFKGLAAGCWELACEPCAQRDLMSILDPKHSELQCFLRELRRSSENENTRLAKIPKVVRVRALERYVSLSNLNEGIAPEHSTVYSSSTDYDTEQYIEGMIKMRRMALESTEHGSSEYSGGGPISEYGLNPSGSSSECQQTREMEMGKTKKDSRERELVTTLFLVFFLQFIVNSIVEMGFTWVS